MASEEPAPVAGPGQVVVDTSVVDTILSVQPAGAAFGVIARGGRFFAYGAPSGDGPTPSGHVGL